MMASRAVLWCMCGLLLCSQAAADGKQLSGRLIHKSWTEADGIFGVLTSITQTTDGTLWLGSNSGLFRFDGIQPGRYAGPADRPFASSIISALSPSTDGGLWIGFRFGGIAYLREGKVVSYGESDGLPRGTVRDIFRDGDGVMWAVCRAGLARLQGGRWETVLSESTANSSLVAGLLDADRTLWIATEYRVFAKRLGETEFREAAVLPKPGVNMLLRLAPDGSLWAHGSDYAMRIDPNRIEQATIWPIRMSYGFFFFDRSGDLWHEGDGNVFRVPSERWRANPNYEDELTNSHFAERAGGLPVGEVGAMFEDREGNMWVGGSDGLARYNRGNLQFVGDPDPLPDAAMAASDGGVVLSTTRHPESILEIKDGIVTWRQPIANGFVSAYSDPDGSVWFGGRGQLGHVVHRRLIMMPLPDRMQDTEVQTMVRDRRGALWVSVVRRGLFEFFDGRWSDYGLLDALPRLPAIAATVDAAGVLWFGYTDNRIARVDGTHVQLFGTTGGLDVGNVTAITAASSGLWIGGELGLAHFNGKRFLPIHAAAGTPFLGVSGVVESDGRDLWINGSTGIAHLAKDEIVKSLRDGTHRVRHEQFDYLDGVPGAAVQLRPTPSAIKGADGRLLFSTGRGLVSIDPAHLHHNSLPPPVTIWSVTAANVVYSLTAAELQLPAKTTKLEIEYTAGSLTVPERVRFRYKLEGLERDWQDAGERRRAFYTNLGPGRYTFHVIAANNDGVWNTAGASYAFTIRAAFYQTWWFYCICTLLCLALLHVLYKVRIGQIRMQVRLRLEERLAERERIARELHDTLLQGVQGLILRFQAATSRIPAAEPARELMNRALERADQVLDEGRHRVKGLRQSADRVTDLLAAFTDTAELLSAGRSALFRISVEGIPRTLHPIIREEAYLIGREALSNAFQHAEACNIEAELSYGAAALELRIRDDGRGIDVDIQKAGGRPGHWGLIGMRERARKIQGQITIWSRAAAGTEIELCVPAALAYLDVGSRWRRARWFRWLFKSSSAVGGTNLSDV